ncbi:MAG: lysostaphin resistance A-like protein [Gemmatimonadota bacterium]
MPDLTPFARGYALALLVGLPALAARTGLREGHAEDVARARYAVYLSAALSLLLFAGGTFAVAAWQGLPPASLGWTVPGAASAFGWGGATAAAGLVFVWIVTRAGRWLGLRESALALAILPRSQGEREAFVLLALVAAVGEEYIYRGFLLHVLAEWTGSPWTAAALAAVSFGLSHGYQRAVGIARSTLLGMALSVPVIWTRSLFPAIVAHLWLNAAIGLGGWRRLYGAGGATPGTDGNERPKG